MTGQDTVLVGGGEMGARMRALDWRQTSLGPVEGWPPALRTAVALLLAAPSSISIFWGAELSLLYNDAMAPLMGAQHPRALGLPLPQVFSEIWKDLSPLIDQVTRTGTTVSLEKRLLCFDRRGFTEETYFTFSYLPIRDEHGRVAGIMNLANEVTAQVLAERRFTLIRELSIRSALAPVVQGVLHEVEGVLAHSGADVPFALLYRVEVDSARLVLRSGLAAGGGLVPETLALGEPGAPWPLAEVLGSGQPRLVEGLETQQGALHAGPWSEPVRRALLYPLVLGTGGTRDAVLVLGLSPRLPLDESSRDFLQLLSRQVAADVVRVQALEQETQRAEQLAALDRARTDFFSNVSHEFRTPLTLLLGPTGHALASPERTLGGEALERVHRHALRLLKLVNTLLDVSRLEAGRTRARFEPTDLAPLTAGLASAFEPVLLTAGMHLVVDCPPLPEPIWVDRDMWEKVVLNLVSNAFKFTLAGSITVRLAWRGEHVALSVRDTGTGIAPEELPRIFERFHRVENARGRSHEGSGIGLSLVRELARLHGGDVTVDSTPGEGSTFTVSLPTGSTHLPREQLRDPPRRASTAADPGAFVQEARQWLSPAPDAPSPPEAPREAPRGHVLLAEDNADMRDYVRRLLEGRFTVEAVADGQAALAAARARPPDVVLSDVMMPGLDGFALVRELKADPRTASVPVVLLSARAGEEARVEGLEAGVEDYLVKPFGARELLARLDSVVRAARGRAERERLLEALRESEERLRRVVDAAGVGLWELEAATGHLATDGHLLALLGLTPGTSLRLESALQSVLAEDREPVSRALSAALAGEHGGRYHQVFRTRERGDAPPRWLESRGQRLLGADGQSVGVGGVVVDITARQEAEAMLSRQSRHNSLVAQVGLALSREVSLREMLQACAQTLADHMGAAFARIWLLEPKQNMLVLHASAGLHSRLEGPHARIPVGRYEVGLIAEDQRPYLSNEVLGDPREYGEEEAQQPPPREGGVTFAGYPLRVGSRLVGVMALFARQPLAQDMLDILEQVATSIALGVERLRAEGELRTRMEFEQQLIGIVSHDLRNPLSAILMGTSLLARNPAQEERTLKSVLRIRSAAERASRMVKDLLDFTQARLGGGLRIEPRPTDLHALTRGVMDEVEAAYPQREVEVLSEGDGRGAWDADRMSQVVQNLVTNALKYSPEDSLVRVTTRAEPKGVSLSISNQGTPIPPEMLSSIFEPLQRGTDEVDRTGRSVGLGLYIVKSIVAAHGGHIAVTSSPAEGTVFTVRLPRSS